MGGIVAAWLVGEGIIVYRSVFGSKNRKIVVQDMGGKDATVTTGSYPPGPGQLALASGLFIILALVAESERARPVATLLAWGFDIAAWLNIGNITTSNSGGRWPPTMFVPPGQVFAGSSTSPNTTGTGSAPPPKFT